MDTVIERLTFMKYESTSRLTVRGGKSGGHDGQGVLMLFFCGPGQMPDAVKSDDPEPSFTCCLIRVTSDSVAEQPEKSGGFRNGRYKEIMVWDCCRRSSTTVECVCFPNSSTFNVGTMRKPVSGLDVIFIVSRKAAVPLISSVSEASAASGDCGPMLSGLCLGGEQDTVELLEDSVDLLGLYSQSCSRLRHSLQGC